MNHRHSGSAHSGLGEWLLQRLSALYLAGFLLWAVLVLAVAPPPEYLAWKAWFSGNGVRLAFALCFLSILVHAWVGMRSVFLDYLKPLWLRFAVQIFFFFGLIALAFWATHILLVEAIR
jgi:succinate dehydrogenase / fumarate reductase membrane anchor subunit